MKKIYLFLTAFLLAATTAFAAPLDDFSKGSGSFSFYGRYSNMSIKGTDTDESFGGLAMTGTVAIAKNIALEATFGVDRVSAYSYYYHGVYMGESTEDFTDYSVKFKYMLLKNKSIALSPYVGWALDNYSITRENMWGDTFNEYSTSRNSLIYGATGVITLITGKVKAYADFGVGNNKWKDVKVGLSFTFNKRGGAIDLGYNWRNVEFKSGDEVSRDGWFLGLTATF